MQIFSPRILFSVAVHDTNDGGGGRRDRWDIFSRKKGAIARHRAAKEAKPVPLRGRSGLIAWKNGRYERFARVRVPFFSHRHVDDAVSRGISPRRIVIYGTPVPPRKEQSSSPDAISPFTCTSTRYTFFRFVVVLLFRRFMQSRRWFEIEDGFEIAVTRREMTYMHLWQRDHRMHFIPGIECEKRWVLILHFVLLAQNWS